MLATAFVSIAFTAAGVVAVDENARRISKGEIQSVVVYGVQAKVNQPAEVTDIEPQIERYMRLLLRAKEMFLSE